MFDWYKFENFFDEILLVDSKSCNLTQRETYKEKGELKTKEINISVELIEVESPLDLIINNHNTEIVNYYPNNIFERIFKRRKNLKFDFDDSVFILSSDKTKSILDTDCKIYEIKEDNKIIIGKRTRLIGYQSGEKIYAYADPESYKTLIIK